MKEEKKKIESIKSLERLVKVGPRLLMVTDAVTQTLLDLFSEDFDSLDKCAGLVVEVTTDYYNGNLDGVFYTTFRNKLLSAIQDCFSDEEILEISQCIDLEDYTFHPHSDVLAEVLCKLHAEFKKRHKQEHKNKEYFDHPVQNSKYYVHALNIALEEYCDTLGL